MIVVGVIDSRGHINSGRLLLSSAYHAHCDHRHAESEKDLLFYVEMIWAHLVPREAEEQSQWNRLHAKLHGEGGL